MNEDPTSESEEFLLRPLASVLLTSQARVENWQLAVFTQFKTPHTHTKQKRMTKKSKTDYLIPVWGASTLSIFPIILFPPCIGKLCAQAAHATGRFARGSTALRPQGTSRGLGASLKEKEAGIRSLKLGEGLRAKAFTKAMPCGPGAGIAVSLYLGEGEAPGPGLVGRPTNGPRNTTLPSGLRPYIATVEG